MLTGDREPARDLVQDVMLKAGAGHTDLTCNKVQR
jgi:hypothetical protein